MIERYQDWWPLQVIQVPQTDKRRTWSFGLAWTKKLHISDSNWKVPLLKSHAMLPTPDIALMSEHHHRMGAIIAILSDSVGSYVGCASFPKIRWVPKHQKLPGASSAERFLWPNNGTFFRMIYIYIYTYVYIHIYTYIYIKRDCEKNKTNHSGDTIWV